MSRLPLGRWTFASRASKLWRMSLIDTFKFNDDGLIPAIIQDHENGQVLMMAWMNRESLGKTIETGYCTYWSRSRQQFWVKGETSGHVQRVKRISVDCDLDTLLIQVEQTGAACHEGYRSCFFRNVDQEQLMTNAAKL
jgi:phosphoribosyl-AMP cyclohydrolase